MRNLDTQRFGPFAAEHIEYFCSVRIVSAHDALRAGGFAA